MAFDRDALSSPIPGESPSGEWLRREGTYAEVKEAMRTDPGDPAYGIPEKKPDWYDVVELCHGALTKKTKDFYLAVCMLEGLAQQRGCEGLRDGLWFLAELHERFWDDFYPRPRGEGDDADIDGRVNQLEALIQGWSRILDGLHMQEDPDGMRLLDWRWAGQTMPGGTECPYTAEDKESAVRSSSWDFLRPLRPGARRGRRTAASLRRPPRQLIRFACLVARRGEGSPRRSPPERSRASCATRARARTRRRRVAT